MPPPPGNVFPCGDFFFGKEVFFAHSHTTVQKRPSRGSEKMYTYIFQVKIVQKRGLLVQIWAPEMAKTAKMAHFGPLSVIFAILGEMRHHAQPDLAMAPKVVFGVPGI